MEVDRMGYMRLVTNLLGYWALFLVSGAALVLIGVGSLRVARARIERPWARMFAAAALGLAVSTVSYALLRTAGRSVFLAAVPLLLWALLQTRAQEFAVTETRIGRREIAWTLLAAHIAFAIFAAVTFKGGGYPFHVTEKRWAYSAVIGRMMDLTGNENTFHVASLVAPAFRGATPYHYFEFWIAAALAHVPGTIDAVVLEAVVTPLVSTAAMLGLWALAERFRGDGPAGRVATIALGLSGPLHVLALGRFSLFTESWSWAGTAKVLEVNEFSAKALSLHVFFLVVALLVLSEEIAFSLCAVAFLPLLSATIAPAALTLFTVLVVYGLWHKKARLIDVAIPVLALLVAVVFYKIMAPAAGSGYASGVNSGSVLAPLHDPGLARNASHILLKTTIQLFVTLLPLALVLRFVDRRSQRAPHGLIVLFAVSGVITVGGLLAYTLLQRDVNAFQALSMPAGPALLACLVAAAATLSTQVTISNRLKWMGAFALAIPGLIGWIIEIRKRADEPYSDEYLLALEAARPRTPFTATIPSHKAALGRFASTYFQVPASAVSLFPQFSPLISLDVLELKSNPDWQAQSALEQSIFFQYWTRQQKTRPSLTAAEAEVMMLRDYHVSSLIVDGTREIPPHLASLVESVVKDPRSQEKLVTLRQ
jgi:hypothetical protein